MSGLLNNMSNLQKNVCDTFTGALTYETKSTKTADRRSKNLGVQQVIGAATVGYNTLKLTSNLLRLIGNIALRIFCNLSNTLNKIYLGKKIEDSTFLANKQSIEANVKNMKHDVFFVALGILRMTPIVGSFVSRERCRSEDNSINEPRTENKPRTENELEGTKNSETKDELEKTENLEIKNSELSDGKLSQVSDNKLEETKNSENSETKDELDVKLKKKEELDPDLEERILKEKEELEETKKTILKKKEETEKKLNSNQKLSFLNYKFN